MRKTKMDLKGGRRLSQTTSKEKEKSLLWSPILNLNLLGFDSLFEKKKKKRAYYKCKFKIKGLEKVKNPYDSLFHTQLFSKRNYS